MVVGGGAADDRCDRETDDGIRQIGAPGGFGRGAACCAPTSSMLRCYLNTALLPQHRAATPAYVSSFSFSMSLKSAAASSLYCGSSTSTGGSAAIACSCTRASEYLPDRRRPQPARGGGRCDRVR